MWCMAKEKKAEIGVVIVAKSAEVANIWLVNGKDRRTSYPSAVPQSPPVFTPHGCPFGKAIHFKKGRKEQET